MESYIKKMAKKEKITQGKAKQVPAGGVVVGKRKGQTMIYDDASSGGYFVGRTHAEGGIDVINKSTGQPLEVQGAEVIITAPAVADQTKNEFNGEMLTNREILSKINEKGGGVAFAKDGMEIPKSVKHTGASYNYGGKTMTDYEIITMMNGGAYKKGGHLAEGLSLRDIADIHQVSIADLKKQVRMGMKAESEHTSSKREQMKIVKDHLFENPEYYTLLEKVGLELGGKLGEGETDKVKYLLDRDLDSDIAEHNLKMYLKEKGYSRSGTGLLSDEVRNDSKYKELKHKFDVEFSKSRNKPVYKYPKSRDRVQEQKDLRRYKEILHQVLNEKYEKGGLIAPNGKRSGLHFTEIYNLVRTKEFKEWFGDWEEAYITKDYEGVSKIIDENGEPLICVHNTPKEFYEFDENEMGSNTDAGFYGKGFYFTPNVGQSRYGEIELNCFLNIKNPYFKQSTSRNYELNSDGLKEQGYDGVVVYPNWVDNFDFTNGVDGCEEVVAYYPEQIKLGDGTNTQFDAYNSDIRFKNGGQVKESLVKDAKSGNAPARDLNNYNDLIDVQADGKVGADSGIDMDGTGGADASAGVGAFKDGGEVYNGWKEGNIYSDGKQFFKKEDKNYSHEILRKKNGEVELTTIALDSEHGESFNRTYSDVEFKHFDSVEEAKKYVKENYEKIDSSMNKKEISDGGEVSNPIVSNWDNINSSWKDTAKIKKVVWSNNPYDKGLYTIVSPYLGNDKLRPVMSGINFDENGITATNAHVLITLPYPNKKYEGIYEPDLSKRPNSDQITIDGRYPNYSAVIPFSENTTHFLIDVYKLLQYTNVAMKYANKTTHQVVYKINNEVAGFNGNFLVENLKTLLKLGHEKVYANYIAPNKAMVLSPSKDYRVGNDEILLTMPVMVQDQRYGARDIDYGRDLSVYFDFDDNEIHNADGSIAEFKMKYENNSPVDIDDVKLLESMVKKNKTLHILDYVSIKDNTLRATNLKADYVIKNVNLPDGIYQPVNGNLEITMNPIGDYPIEPIFVSDEDTIEFSIPSNIFEYYIDKFKFVLDQDDLRPIFKGISLKHTSDNKLFLLGTDSKLGLKIDITKYVDMPLYNREIQTVIDPVWLFAFLAKLEEGTLHIKSNNVATIIDSDSKNFYCRNVDGNYPNLEAVIPQTSDDLISIEYSALKKCLNNEFMKNYKKQTAKSTEQQTIGVFDKNEEVFVGRRYKNISNSDFTDIEKLCDIKIKSSKEEYTYDNGSVLLAMPLISEQQDNFAFDEKLLSKVMTIVNDSELEMHHNGTKRAFLIPIHSFDYEKTTVEHKVREQKPTLEQEQIIAEVEEIDEIKEAIEVMQMLLETAPKKDKKEIVEAIEVMEMLLESYQN